jgi:hypothetical protein
VVALRYVLYYITAAFLAAPAREMAAMGSTKDKDAAIKRGSFTGTLPFHWQFVAGAVAGVSETIIMYPLDGTILVLDKGLTNRVIVLQS